MRGVHAHMVVRQGSAISMDENISAAAIVIWEVMSCAGNGVLNEATHA